MKKYFVRVYDDIWPQVVYGPFDGDEIEHLGRYFAEVLPYAQDDGIFLLEIDDQANPTMRAFSDEDIQAACKVSQATLSTEMFEDKEQEPETEQIGTSVQATLWIPIKSDRHGEDFVTEIIELICKYENEPGSGVIKWKVEE